MYVTACQSRRYCCSLDISRGRTLREAAAVLLRWRQDQIPAPVHYFPRSRLWRGKRGLSLYTQSRAEWFRGVLCNLLSNGRHSAQPLSRVIRANSAVTPSLIILSSKATPRRNLCDPRLISWAWSIPPSILVRYNVRLLAPNVRGERCIAPCGP